MAPVTDNTNHLHGRGLNLFIIAIVFSWVAAFLVVARLLSRYRIGRNVGKDDYVISVSMVFSIALTMADCIGVAHGYGKAQATLSVGDVHMTLQTFWAEQILYKFTINLTKVSICLLYLRIFNHIKWFRITIYCIIAVVGLYAVSSIVATIAECVPTARVWDHHVEGKCIDLTKFWYANASVNIIGDFVIFLVPMPLVWNMQLPVRQRLGLGLVFSLGLFVCVTSILRTTTLNASSKSKDQTHGTLTSTIWTTIEANTGIICACLPMIKAPLAALFPKLFPHGSLDGSGKYSRRPRSHLVQRLPLPASFDDRGRLVHTPSPALTGLSTNTTFGLRRGDVPLGQIGKTTHVDVQYDYNIDYPEDCSVGCQRSTSIPNLNGR